jgi:hypothetical protein
VESGTRRRRLVSKCSGRGGEERGARMSVVEMVGSVAPFYRVGEAIERGGWPVVVGIQYWPFRRVKGGGEQTAAHGAAAPTEGDGGSGETEEEESLGGPVMGRKAVVTWAGVGISKENWDALPWPLGRIDGLNRRACRNYFQIYFKYFDSNQRGLNIFKPNLN